MKVAIVGSRDFTDYKIMYREMQEWEKENLGTMQVIEAVISGGAKGADSLAEKYAKDFNIEFVKFLPDHKRYRHPYHHRNRLIAEACDHLIAFWDGRSTGTKYTIGYAKRVGRPVTVVRYK